MWELWELYHRARGFHQMASNGGHGGESGIRYLLGCAHDYPVAMVVTSCCTLHVTTVLYNFVQHNDAWHVTDLLHLIFYKNPTSNEAVRHVSDQHKLQSSGATVCPCIAVDHLFTSQKAPILPVEGCNITKPFAWHHQECAAYHATIPLLPTVLMQCDVIYLSGTDRKVPTRSVFRDRRHWCLVCAHCVCHRGGGMWGIFGKPLKGAIWNTLGLHTVLTVCLRFLSFLDGACVACCLLLSTGSHYVRLQIHAMCCCIPRCTAKTFGSQKSTLWGCNLGASYSPKNRTKASRGWFAATCMRPQRAPDSIHY